MEAWTERELERMVAAKVEPADTITLTLPERAVTGPGAVELVSDHMPLSDDPIEAMIRRQADSLRQQQIESQVTVEVVWRSRLGVWADRHMTTG